MGCHMSKRHQNRTSKCTNSINNQKYTTTDLYAYEAVDLALQPQTINVLAAGVEVRALSLDSLREVTECLLQMDREVVKVIVDCKEYIRGNDQGLLELIREYLDNSLKTIDFCAALQKCLKSAKENQLLHIHEDLQLFEDEGSDQRYSKMLDELQSFKNAVDPFTEDFFHVFQSIRRQQTVTLEKLQLKKKKLDKKVKCIHTWRKVSCIIFAAAVAAFIICSVVAAAMAAPHMAAALAAASSVPLGSMGKWMSSLFKKYISSVNGQKEIVNSMNVGTYVAIKDLEMIRVLIDRLEVEIQSLMVSVHDGINEETVEVAMEEIRKKLVVFVKNVEELGVQANRCSHHIHGARTVILQRIIKHPNY